MASTHTCLNFHVIFSTKDRVGSIADVWRCELHAYLGGVLRAMEVVPVAVGGVKDHVHVLVSLRSSHCLADVMRELKTVSSRWVRENHLRTFTWQEGYGAFTVSPSHREHVCAYIANQEEHHRRRTFAEELTMLLEKSGVAFDPRYL